MRVSCRRAWSPFGAACRSLLLAAAAAGKRDEAALRAGTSRGGEGLGRAFSRRGPRDIVDGSRSGFAALNGGAIPRSCRAEVGAAAGEDWAPKSVCRLRGLSDSCCELSGGLSGGGFFWRGYTSEMRDCWLQSRHFAASAREPAKRPRGARNDGKVRHRERGQSRSKTGNAPAKKGRPQFRGPLSSIGNLASEVDARNARGRWGRAAATKRKPTSPNPSSRKSGRAIDCPDGSKEKSLSDGTWKRRRKRIKPNPRDSTYKRSVDSDVKTAAIVSERNPVTEDISASAQFRRIQPSAQLLAHIEKNFLGRRRLIEWRRGGYDPKRTAPLDDLPDAKTKRNPIQETVFKNRLVFVAAAKQAPSIPTLEYPEIAFAGRSNVGKSSLINALTRRWGAARISEKPGLTQSINFFTLGSRLCLVDLPGYGFAYAKEEKKDAWEELVKHYVQSRANLERVCMLVDARWGLKPRDEELIHLMESAGTGYQIVITKTDVLSPADLARRATQILQVLECHRYLVQPLAMVSAKSGAGLQHFRSSLANIAARMS